MSASDSTLITEEYLSAVKRPAECVHDFCTKDRPPLEILDGKAFVIPNVLTDQECDELIATCEEYGILPTVVGTGSGRSAKRTSMYANDSLSALVSERVQSLLEPKFRNEEDNIEGTDYLGPFAGIHSNWRVLRYDEGDSFPAHQDQMDSFHQRKEDGTKDLIVSSHTLLLSISKDGVEGGATRFYPQAKVKGTSLGQYDYAVDVILPRGWAVAFLQKGLVHAGQTVTKGPKYVAQAGVLRKLPPGKLFQPSVFRVGPGVQALANEAESNKQQEADENGMAGMAGLKMLQEKAERMKLNLAGSPGIKS